ncbi:MAG: hypothetical protein R3C68_12535 [Myxococcota bacterium]
MQIRGCCHVILAYDVGAAIDLERAESTLSEGERRKRFKNRRRAPQEDGLRPPPLRLQQIGDTVEIAAHITEPAVEMVLYEFGAICVIYRTSFDCSLETLVGLSDGLYDNPALLDNSWRRVKQIMHELREAIHKPDLSVLMEDYSIFNITSPIDKELLWTTHSNTVSRILRVESDELSEQQVDDALSRRLSYTPNDVLIVDWAAAMLIGDDMQDERMVLELGLVHLLELRILDAQLDRGVHTAYDLLSSPRRWIDAFRAETDTIRHVSELQVDSALFFEGVNNGVKLVGDQYLARMYRMVAQRFQLHQWDEAVERKLRTLDGIYDKLASRNTNHRMEILEWVIIVLIALSIGVYFIPGVG